MKKAIFPGSFDPLTNGHLDVIEQVSVLFDRVIVAVAKNPHKTPMFSVEERMRLIELCVAPMANVTVDSFSGLLADYAREQGAVASIRGLRDAGDIDFELRMSKMNRHLNSQCVTLLVATKTEYAMVSSSLVKEVLSHGGDVRPFVPPIVYQSLCDTLGGSDKSPPPGIH